MHNTIEMLIKGEKPVEEYYRRAMRLWQGLLKDDPSHAELAERIGSAQMAFERECGGRWEGQEVMAVVGIAQFYSTLDGFNDRAMKAKAVYDALLASNCSIEVHGHARRVAESYYLQDEVEQFGDD